VHCVAPALPAKVPGVQGEQDVTLPPLEYEPAKQVVHVPLLSYWPGGQITGVQALLPADDDVPAGH
jgi:hypothetical protein